MTDEASVAAFAKDALADAPEVHVLVNNAGVGAWGATDQLDVAAWRRAIDTSLTGPFLVTRASCRRSGARRAGAASSTS